jgi:hypothetical protein
METSHKEKREEGMKQAGRGRNERENTTPFSGTQRAKAKQERRDSEAGPCHKASEKT